ncbi:MAG: hypothetical protein EZS28_042258 [Streblomastix strix]|uniref:Uncharacterized protein n=1 Tax=Streblomastix strix TaxID=222440 RepID=A0A5J4TXT8_9EUKA|nr:MAG: hypothetical protein EZS28_042258 [Streblomastix strix]
MQRLQNNFAELHNKYFEQLFVENNDNPAANADAPSVVDPPTIMSNLVKSQEIYTTSLAYPSALIAPVCNVSKSGRQSNNGKVSRTTTT